MKAKPIFIASLILLITAIFLYIGCASSQVQTITLSPDPNYRADAAEKEMTESLEDESAVAGKQPVVETNEGEPEYAESGSGIRGSIDARVDVLQRLKREAGLDRNPIITVLDLESQGLSEKDALFVGDFISGGLYKTDIFRVIDRRQRDILLEEMQFSMSGCSDESCQLEAGRLLAAENIVVGNVGKIGNRYILNARMIDVSSGETVSASDNIYKDFDALIDDCMLVSIDLTETFLAKLTK